MPGSGTLAESTSPNKEPPPPPPALDTTAAAETEVTDSSAGTMSTAGPRPIGNTLEDATPASSLPLPSMPSRFCCKFGCKFSACTCTALGTEVVGTSN
eukprot:5186743-Alexandrium_andersonii.AAC.1